MADSPGLRDPAAVRDRRLYMGLAASRSSDPPRHRALRGRNGECAAPTAEITEVMATIQTDLFRTEAEVLMTAHVGNGGRLDVFGTLALARVSIGSSPVRQTPHAQFEGSLRLSRFDFPSWLRGLRRASQARPGRIRSISPRRQSFTGARGVRCHGLPHRSRIGLGRTAWTGGCPPAWPGAGDLHRHRLQFSGRSAHSAPARPGRLGSAKHPVVGGGT